MTDISYEDFKKLEMKVGYVINCAAIPNTDNLYKLMVDCGEKNPRQIVTGMKKFYTPQDFIHEKIIILTNLESKKIMGIKSEGMVLAADIDGEPVLLKLDSKKEKKVPPGSKIK